MSDFEFDRWCELAQTDPEAFFRARTGAIDSLIESRPERERERLRAMQQCIDCERACAGSPAKALQLMLFMIYERLIVLQRQSEALRVLAAKASRVAADQRLLP